MFTFMQLSKFIVLPEKSPENKSASSISALAVYTYVKRKSSANLGLILWAKSEFLGTFSSYKISADNLSWTSFKIVASTVSMKTMSLVAQSTVRT